MATYAVQPITRHGALCAQVILNHARTVEWLQKWTVGELWFAVSILVVGGSFQERTALGELAVADVFFNRASALRFVNQLQAKEEKQQ